LCGGALIVSRYSRTISSHVSLFVKRPHIVKTHAHADRTGDVNKPWTQCGRSRRAVGAIELDRSSAVHNHVKTSKCWTAISTPICSLLAAVTETTTFTLESSGMNGRRLETLACLITVALGTLVSCATNKPEMAWVRTDGRRIGNDPDLLKQGQTDIAVCNANLDAGAVERGERLYGEERLRSCAQRPSRAGTSRIRGISPSASYDTFCGSQVSVAFVEVADPDRARAAFMR
jgi:hypothetical protein